MGYNVVKDAKRVRALIGLAIDVSKGFYSSLSGFENLVFCGLLNWMTLSNAKGRAREVLGMMGPEDLKVSDSLFQQNIV
ncbi:MAG: hypothetical protein QXP97_00275 [Desulfurococcus sp.]|uniref:hypothetical protein n=1 Tax=Desulfurococcus sp. TaxID=51678 RepID=UPI00315FFE07